MPGLSRSVEALLWVLALTCGLLLTTRYIRSQSSAREARSLALSPVIPHSNSRSSDEADDADPSAVVASLQIDALHLQVPVLSQCSVDTLKRGTCRVQGTASIGGLGTTGIAGHRDTVFRPLEGVRAGQIISLKTRTGLYRYRVDTTEIVSPDETGVLDIHEQPALVLITCYPFRYVGSAPKRFIVHASLQSMTVGSSSAPEAR